MLKVQEIQKQIDELEKPLRAECEKMVGKTVIYMLENEEVRAVISEYYAGVFWLLDGNVLTVEDIIGVAE